MRRDSGSKVCTLAELAVGDEGVVTQIEGPRDVTRRLMEMGLLPGTSIKLVRRAPMGDPLEIRLRAYSLSLRAREASGVTLEPTAG